MERAIVIPIKKASEGAPRKNQLLIDRCLEKVLSMKYPVWVIGDDTDLLEHIKEKYGSQVRTHLLPQIEKYADVTKSLQTWRNESGFCGEIALVQCTSPFLQTEWIEKCFNSITENVITATACEINFKPTALFMEKDGIYIPCSKELPPASVARQLLPHTIRINGAVEVFHTSCLDYDSFYDAHPMIPIIVDEDKSLDVDTEEDLIKALNN